MLDFLGIQWLTYKGGYPTWFDLNMQYAMLIGPFQENIWMDQSASLIRGVSISLSVLLRGDPREIFRSVQNLNCFQNHLILWQISCSFHIWKPFLAAVFSFPTMHFFIQATFGWKKHAIQQGQKNFFVSDSFLTYGGFTHPTSRISM